MTKTILHFHIGRGGRFNNTGYTTYKGIEDASIISNYLFFPKYKNGNDITRSNTHYMLDETGNELSATVNEYNRGVGVYDWDGDYDTDSFIYADDLDEDLILLILQGNDPEDFRYYPDLYEILSNADVYRLVGKNPFRKWTIESGLTYKEAIELQDRLEEDEEDLRTVIELDY